MISTHNQNTLLKRVDKAILELMEIKEALAFNDSKSIKETEIINHTLDFFGISLNEFLGDTRKKHIVQARTFFSLFMFEEIGSTKTQIAKWLNKSHGTVVVSLPKLKEDIKNYKEVADRYNRYKVC
tara:strand:- start:2377 stop:2754 length:378 start_codon:yes stop_codon:yes gene_type:complete